MTVYASVCYRWASVNLFMEETRVQLDCDLCAAKRPLTASAFTSNRVHVYINARARARACFARVCIRARAYIHHKMNRVNSLRPPRV